MNDYIITSAVEELLQEGIRWLSIYNLRTGPKDEEAEFVRDRMFEHRLLFVAERLSEDYKHICLLTYRRFHELLSGTHLLNVNDHGVFALSNSFRTIAIKLSNAYNLGLSESDFDIIDNGLIDKWRAESQKRRSGDVYGIQ